jgi:hypothetical protein
VDIHATLCEIFGVAAEHRTHGTSLVPVITNDITAVRDYVLTGVWGRGVQVIDRTHSYSRAPRPGNRPLSMWSNRWSTMPIKALPEVRLPRPDRRANLDYMPGSDVPVIRQPFGPEDPLPFWARPHPMANDDLLYDLVADPGQVHNRVGEASEVEMTELLRHALASVEAPTEQFTRLGL